MPEALVAGAEPRRFTTSWVRHARDNRVRIVDLTWSELGDELAKRWRGRDKKKAPAFSPAIFREGINHFEERDPKTRKIVREWDAPAKSGEIQRLDVNVHGWSLLVFDLEDDEGRFTPARCRSLLEELKARRLAFIVYSTFAHSLPDDLRLRLVLRPNRVIANDEIELVRQGGVAELGLFSDPTCKNPGRLFFVPSSTPEVTDDQVVFERNDDGEDVDVDFLKRKAPLPKPAPAPAAAAPLRPYTGPVTDKLDRARRYADAVPPAVERQHGDDRTFTLCATLARGFDLSDEEVLAAIAGWNACCQPPWEQDELLTKIRNARAYGDEPIGGRLEQRAPASAPPQREEPPPPGDEDAPPTLRLVHSREPGEDDGEVDAPEAPSAAPESPCADYVQPERRTVEQVRRDARPPADPLAPAPLLANCIDAALAMMERRARGEEKPIPSPWPDINTALGGGFWPGMHVLTGGTALGKSAYALQLALSAALAGSPVLYVGLELEQAQIVARLMSLMLGMAEPESPLVQWSEIYLGRSPASLERARMIAPLLQQLPIHIEEGPPGGWRASALQERVKALRAAHPEAPGTPLVVLDFLQLVGAEESARRAELRERIGTAAYAARETARKQKAAVLLLSSVSRASGREIGAMADAGELGVGDPAELIAQGKESGDIEFAADSVLALAREPKTDDSTGPTLVHVAIAKVRAGRPRWALLRFNGSWFEPATDEVRNEAQHQKNADEARRRLEKQEARKRAELDVLVLKLVEALRQAGRPLGRGSVEKALCVGKEKATAAMAELVRRGIGREAKHEGGKKDLGVELFGTGSEADFAPQNNPPNVTPAEKTDPGRDPGQPASGPRLAGHVRRTVQPGSLFADPASPADDAKSSQGQEHPIDDDDDSQPTWRRT